MKIKGRRCTHPQTLTSVFVGHSKDNDLTYIEFVDILGKVTKVYITPFAKSALQSLLNNEDRPKGYKDGVKEIIREKY